MSRRPLYAWHDWWVQRSHRVAVRPATPGSMSWLGFCGSREFGPGARPTRDKQPYILEGHAFFIKGSLHFWNLTRPGIPA